jgi:hypothetical protein
MQLACQNVRPLICKHYLGYENTAPLRSAELPINMPRLRAISTRIWTDGLSRHSRDEAALAYQRDGEAGRELRAIRPFFTSSPYHRSAVFFSVFVLARRRWHLGNWCLRSYRMWITGPCWCSAADRVRDFFLSTEFRGRKRTSPSTSAKSLVVLNTRLL